MFYGAFWAPMGYFGVLEGFLGCPMGHFGILWGYFGVLEDFLACPMGHFGILWVLEGFLVCPIGNNGILWGILGSWQVFWAALWDILGSFGLFWVPQGFWGDPRINLGALGAADIFWGGSHPSPSPQVRGRRRYEMLKEINEALQLAEGGSAPRP